MSFFSNRIKERDVLIQEGKMAFEREDFNKAIDIGF